MRVDIESILHRGDRGEGDKRHGTPEESKASLDEHGVGLARYIIERKAFQCLEETHDLGEVRSGLGQSLYGIEHVCRDIRT
jgi:hypothetical protein